MMEALRFPWEDDDQNREVAPSAFRPRKNRKTSPRTQASRKPREAAPRRRVVVEDHGAAEEEQSPVAVAV